MSAVGDAIDDVRTQVGAVMSQFSPNTCTISRNVMSKTSAGVDISTLTSVYTNQPCKYKAVNAQQRFGGGSILASANHILTLPFTIEVRPDDVVVVAATDTVEAKTFKVIGPVHRSMGIFQEVAVAEDATADMAARDA